MMNDDERKRMMVRLQASVEALENLRAEIEPWLMEEREMSGREALTNVIAHLDAEIAELYRRQDTVGQHLSS
jgi:hypothetical protein